MPSAPMLILASASCDDTIVAIHILRPDDAGRVYELLLMIDQQFASTVDYFDAEIARSFYSFDVRLEFLFACSPGASRFTRRPAALALVVYTSIEHRRGTAAREQTKPSDW